MLTTTHHLKMLLGMQRYLGEQLPEYFVQVGEEVTEESSAEENRNVSNFEFNCYRVIFELTKGDSRAEVFKEGREFYCHHFLFDTAFKMKDLVDSDASYALYVYTLISLFLC